MSFTTFLRLIAFGSVVAVAQADRLQTGMQTREGVFEGFRDDTFHFRLPDGKLHREKRYSVVSLELDAPVDVFVTYTRQSKKPVETQFVAYRTMQFVFRKDGKDESVFPANIREIALRVQPGSGSGQRPGTGAAIPALDLSGVESSPDLSPAQKKAIEDYKSARARYDAFLRESSKLVSDMDAAKGAEREALLNKLRLRKQEEQPVIQSLQSATDRLRRAFADEQAEANDG